MKITFHTFSMGDVEDPDMYAAEPIWQWQQTAQGQWAMENAHNLIYHTMPDLSLMGGGYRIAIRGDITDARKITEYFLRWPTQNQS